MTQVLDCEAPHGTASNAAGSASRYFDIVRFS